MSDYSYGAEPIVLDMPNPFAAADVPFASELYDRFTQVQFPVVRESLLIVVPAMDETTSCVMCGFALLLLFVASLSVCLRVLSCAKKPEPVVVTGVPNLEPLVVQQVAKKAPPDDRLTPEV